MKHEINEIKEEEIKKYAASLNCDSQSLPASFFIIRMQSSPLFLSMVSS